MQGYLLTLIIFIPLLAAGVLIIVPDNRPQLIKYVSLAATLSQLVIAIIILGSFRMANVDTHLVDSFQFVEQKVWFEMSLASFGSFQVEYFLGLDGISLPLVLLSVILLVIGVISSWNLTKQVKGYFMLYLLLATSIVGCFLALDFFLFYLFFELMLLPMFFLIGIWGGKRRSYASIKFFIYTLVGSLFILMVMIALYISVTNEEGVHTFNILSMMSLENFESGSLLDPANLARFLGLHLRELAFLALMLGFAIKLPAAPLHTWLPDAHVEAPTAISVILAGLLLKVGGYSFFRIAYAIFPDAAVQYSFFLGGVGVFSIIYGGLNALAQTDFKRLVAYSSVSHMGFVLLGLSVLTNEGVSGSLFHMISHGLISGALFLIVGVVYDRSGDRTIENFSGLASKLPLYTFVVVVVFFASLGLPGLSGFVGEILVLMGVFAGAKQETVPVWFAILSTVGIIVSAVYYLWTLQRMFFGQYWLRDQSWEPKMVDLSIREMLMLLPLVLLIIVLGIWPRAILDYSEVTISQFLQHVLRFPPL